MASSVRKILDAYSKRKFIRLGIPFVVFVAGGSFFLKQFASLRYEFRKGKMLTKEEAESMGLKTVDVKIASQEMLKEVEKADLDQWQNIRGPRPWEDSKTVQQEQRQLKETVIKADSR
ncbi:cytochrome c oxidase assembly protein COX16 homolog, mitochondrial [Aplysia californica]|uniref:Cytochrome c oxidase assembly protein COX16 homolog, mitochondrial n=1 Tax=Aplysia californica TaxID=6500 RepID=A0ABM1ABZ4_APLCA|nr:cytochrome c oxidase assembly protein COX16 homolog, mitochondrial [Aplysia californica]